MSTYRKVGVQPPVGDSKVHRGRKWRKVRTLRRRDWETALLTAAFSARMLGSASDDDLRGMGYVPADEAPTPEAPDDR